MTLKKRLLPAKYQTTSVTSDEGSTAKAGK